MNSPVITKMFEFHEECVSAADSLKRKSALNRIVGKSKTVQALRNKIEKISSCEVDVLISGKRGTGKNIVARAIHYLSRRAGKPFIPVNCIPRHYRSTIKKGEKP